MSLRLIERFLIEKIADILDTKLSGIITENGQMNLSSDIIAGTPTEPISLVVNGEVQVSDGVTITSIEPNSISTSGGIVVGSEATINSENDILVLNPALVIEGGVSIRKRLQVAGREIVLGDETSEQLTFINCPEAGSTRTLVIPDTGIDCDFALVSGTQTFQDKTYQAPVLSNLTTMSDTDLILGIDASGFVTSFPTLNKLSLVPSGCVNMWLMDIVPSGWLECDGSQISRSGYSELFNVIGTEYGIGDGSTTFNLPDMRGMFVRGDDNGSGNDPDFLTRTPRQGQITPGPGSTQNYATALPSNQFTTSTDGSHAHDIIGWSDNVGGTDILFSADQVNQETGTTELAGSHSHSVTGGGDLETRPKNFSVKFIIKI